MITDQLSEMMIRSGRVGSSELEKALAIQEEAHELGILQRMIPVKPIKTAAYPTPAKRPAYSVLDKASTCAVLGYTPSPWRESLKKMLTELKELQYV